jgi:LmbE family N-acetylglucosaminyl deacetylase
MNILFILAHPDDESYGPAGTIAKLAQDHNVTVVSLCNGSRPGNDNVAAYRSGVFSRNCELVNAKWKIYNSQDCTLEYDSVLKTVEALVDFDKPDVVYTHNISDIHRDHRLVAECCMVACRPKPESTVQALYMCEIPASTEWGFGQFGEFKPNTFVDITDFMPHKIKMLEQYKSEVYNHPDARSVENMRVLAEKRGMNVGVRFAEAFQLVFQKL